MEIKEIIYVKTIADFGNLTKAAETLHITQPSLSQGLKNIEAKLGVELFIRTKRGMLLTEYGKTFMSDASSLLTAYEVFMNKIEHYRDVGITRFIGLYKLSYTTSINNAVMHFISHHDDDNYMIKVDSISNLERMLLQNKLDIAIIKYAPIQKRNDELIYDLLFKERLFVLLNKNHPLASRTSIKLEELEGNRLITSDPSEYPHKMIEEIMNHAGVHLEIHTHINYSNLSMIYDFVSQGLGITFATEDVCDYFMNENVVKVSLEEVFDYEVCVVQKKKKKSNDGLINYIRRLLD